MQIVDRIRPIARRLALADAATDRRIFLALRIALAACFIGHGAFGVITKADWVPYFAVVGIPEWVAWRLMPPIGTMDITLGVLTLFYPIRAVLVWAVFWCTWTALLRPLAGQGIWEFVERGGNYGVPLAMLYMAGLGRSFATWFGKAAPRRLGLSEAQRVAWILRVTTALLLIGHGGFGVFVQKQQAWTRYFGVLGIGPDVVQSAPLIVLVGAFEMALGVAVLLRPAAGLLVFVFAWKVGTEALRLPAGEPIWEFLERGGSYGAPLALLLVERWRRNMSDKRIVGDFAPPESTSAVISSLRRAA